MLTKKEEKISSALNIENISVDNSVDKILEYEKKYNKNSLEILNQKENLNADFIKWQLLVEKLVYFNSDFFKINKISDIKYITYNKRLVKSQFGAYLDEVKKYVSENPNTIFLLSNNSEYYKSILGGLNHRDIVALFITDNKDDLYLEYSNIIVQYSKNIKEIVKSLKPKVLSFNIEGDVI